ncbi:hypothetical protein D3C87_1517620 [compost metagenome]
MHDLQRQGLMRYGKQVVLQGMGEWSVAYVMQQDGQFRAGFLFWADAYSFLFQLVQCNAHQMGSTK